jgi:hypothetical protein
MFSKTKSTKFYTPLLNKFQTESRGSIPIPDSTTPPSSESPSNSRRNTLRRQKRHPLDENTLRLVLVSESEEVAVALADEFTNEYFPEVTVVKGINTKRSSVV